MNILSRICDIRPRVKYMMSRIRDNRPMSVNSISRLCFTVNGPFALHGRFVLYVTVQ